MAIKEATFGAGCFWCVEAIFDDIQGVNEVHSGYSGGHIKNPAYREVCTGRTGHAEVARIIFDEEIVSFDKLLEVFWYVHNPTTLNRQGNDIGDQYRSVVFYHDEAQKEKAELYKHKLEESEAFDDPIVTEISELENFYKADSDHHDYYVNNPNQPYCQAVVRPKVEKFKSAFSEILK